MNQLSKTLKHYKNIALSDSDVLKLINNKANLEVYPNLNRYKTIDELLGNYGACIILYEAEPNYGHWCCIFKVNNDTLEYFNPYGGYNDGSPDDTLKNIPYDFRIKSNQYYPYLSVLMYNSPYKLSYNEIKFQKHDNNIKTCGRWCALRILFRDYNLYDFENIIKYLSNTFKISSDDIVTLLTV
jgi:hypothetical protein